MKTNETKIAKKTLKGKKEKERILRSKGKNEGILTSKHVRSRDLKEY